jgi:hypothetical protein
LSSKAAFYLVLTLFREIKRRQCMRRNVISTTMGLLMFSAALFGCGGGSSAVALPAAAANGAGEADSNALSRGVTLYNSFGSVQCTGGGVSLEAMQQQLAAAGIQVLSANCGTDGRMYIAVCGAADGRIGIFEVPATQAEAALALGFAPLSNLPGATTGACR